MTQILRHTLRLEGCVSSPLANYLKALGVFRLVSEQVDPGATAWWSEEVFCLCSSLDESGLIDFFADAYRPTPVIAPWNGGGGFHPGKDRSHIDAIMNAAGSRFQSYKSAVCVASQAIARLGLSEDKKAFKEQFQRRKNELLQHLRNDLGEWALAWLDAVMLLTDDRPQFPPVLGTGGNDGNLEFTKNFMQRLIDLIDMNTDASHPDCRQFLLSALFNTPASDLPRKKRSGNFTPERLAVPI